MNLYDLSQEILNFEFEFDEETGEVLNLNDLDNLKLGFNQKCDNIIRYIKNLESDVESLKNEEKNLKNRRILKENKILGLKKYLEDIMNFNQIKRLEFVSGVVSFRQSNPLEINETMFMAWAKANNSDLLTIKYEIDKNSVKELLKKGKEIPYAKIIKKQNLNIK